MFELYITVKIKQKKKKKINFPVLVVLIESCSVNSCNCGVPVGGGERRVFLLHLLGPLGTLNMKCFSSIWHLEMRVRKDSREHRFNVPVEAVNKWRREPALSSPSKDMAYCSQISTS